MASDDGSWGEAGMTDATALQVLAVDMKFGTPLYEKWFIRPLATVDSSIVVMKEALALSIPVLY